MRLHGDIERGSAQYFLIGKNIKDCLAQTDNGGYLDHFTFSTPAPCILDFSDGITSGKSNFPVESKILRLSRQIGGLGYPIRLSLEPLYWRARPELKRAVSIVVAVLKLLTVSSVACRARIQGRARTAPVIHMA